jgi:hypothetical protein
MKPVIRIARFEVAAADTEEMLVRRAALIAAVRARFSGLDEARLAKIEGEAWVDVWRWESAGQLQAALDGAPGLPETRAAFALTKNATAELAEIVDER